MPEQAASPGAGAERPRAHTYSIVAHDPQSGEMGVAVQSHWFSVGSLVPWAEAGVGAIATQAAVNVSFGPRGLELLRAGKKAPEALQALIAEDEGREVRQLAIVDAGGNAVAYTGARCVPEAGHLTGDGFAVQANLMLNDRVWPAMARAFEESRGPLAERLVLALEAAQEAGGDIRGRQSAALLVVAAQPAERPWEGRLVDLRVEDHAEPVRELKRLLRVHRAYERMNEGDLALERGKVEAALTAYRAASVIYPEQLEIQFWHAISLANVGKVEHALPIFKRIFEKDDHWRTLTRRLPGVGLLKVGEQELEQILAQE
jgi:uncharacterized Ntn-hydrolase superfamily protein